MVAVVERALSLARRAPDSARAGWMPLPKRRLASLGSFSAWVVRRMLMKSKFADSSRMLRVVPSISVSSPPITPATAIGPAVNLVCRLEGLTKTLERPILLSGGIAQAAHVPLVSLGRHPMRGLSEPQEVFALA
mgnify:CR=1 FL=1